MKGIKGIHVHNKYKHVLDTPNANTIFFYSINMTILLIIYGFGHYIFSLSFTLGMIFMIFLVLLL